MPTYVHLRNAIDSPTRDSSPTHIPFPTVDFDRLVLSLDILPTTRLFLHFKFIPPFATIFLFYTLLRYNLTSYSIVILRPFANFAWTHCDFSHSSTFYHFTSIRSLPLVFFLLNTSTFPLLYPQFTARIPFSPSTPSLFIIPRSYLQHTSILLLVTFSFR
jgi:hypothetical protein